MPVLPWTFQHASSASDSRSLESRQLLDAASHLAQTTASQASSLVKRMASWVPHANTDTLSKRQNSDGYILVIPSQYQGLNAGPSPGTVVGIVLGSVGGFLLLLWLLWMASNGPFGGGVIVGGERVIEEVRVASPARTRRSRKTEMSSRRPERAYREEVIIRDRPATRQPSRVREVREAYLGERRVPGDDQVVVEEDHSDLRYDEPRTTKSRRGSYRSVNQSGLY